MARFHRCATTRTVLLVAVAAATGCNKSDGTTMKTNPAKPTAAKTGSIWEPDPGWAGELTQTLSFDKYQLSGPKTLVADPDGAKSNGKMNRFSWSISSGTDIPEAVLLAMVAEDQGLVGEARKDMKQALVNFTAGVTSPYDIKPRRTSQPESGTLGGIKFTRFKWNAPTKTGTRLEGLSYGGVDGDRSILFVVLGFGPDADSSLVLMQAVLATFKTK